MSKLDLNSQEVANLASRRQKWWGASRLVMSRFASGFTKTSIPHENRGGGVKHSQKKLQKTSQPLVEMLEPRILLNADLTPWLAPLAEGLDDLSDFLDDVENIDVLSQPLPIFGESIDKLVDLSDIVQDVLVDFQRLLADADNLTDKSADWFSAELGADSYTYSEAGELTFTFNLGSSDTPTLFLDAIDGVTGLDASVNSSLTLTIGVDLTASGSDAFFVEIGDATLSLGVSNSDIDTAQ